VKRNKPDENDLLELVTRSRAGFLEAPPADEATGQGDEGVVQVEASFRTASRLKWCRSEKVCSTT
jgi:hypothetical protein